MKTWRRYGNCVILTLVTVFVSVLVGIRSDNLTAQAAAPYWAGILIAYSILALAWRPRGRE